MTGALVLKLGGELLESAASRSSLAAAIAALAACRPLIVVHGGGRLVDTACDRLGIESRKVDGLRITDERALDVAVSVLGGLANTRLVAALVARGVSAVGLSGVDAGFGRATRAGAYTARDGRPVDLGFVGDPEQPDLGLIELLLRRGYVPVIASLGIEAPRAGRPAGDAVVLNVNADVMAGRIAASLPGADLVIAGGTPGVLDTAGRTIPVLDPNAVDALVADGTASAGMIAKLAACRMALDAGVASVRIIDGRALDAAARLDAMPGTALTQPASLTGSLR